MNVDLCPESPWLRFGGICFCALLWIGGLSVGVAFGAPSPDVPKEGTVNGVIKSVEAAAQVFQIRGTPPGANTSWGNINEYQLHLLPTTVITLNGEPTTFETIQKDQKATVTWERVLKVENGRTYDVYNAKTLAAMDPMAKVVAPPAGPIPPPTAKPKFHETPQPMKVGIWEPINYELMRKLDLGMKGIYHYSNLGYGPLVLLPNGDVMASLSHAMGTYKSSDQGESWSKVEGKGFEKVNGAKVFHGSGRVALSLSGMVSVSDDSGKTWACLDKKVTNFIDMDLETSLPPKVLLSSGAKGDVLLSVDGGSTSNALPAPLGEPGASKLYKVGIVDATTLIRSEKPADEKGRQPSPGILLSTNGGSTWTKVADFSPEGELIHFGPNLYFRAKEGTILSTDGGKSWSLYGKSLPGSPTVHRGPIFGASEKEMMIVTRVGSGGDYGHHNDVWITRDAGQSWTNAAMIDFNDAGHLRGEWAWDAKENVVYVSGQYAVSYRGRIK
jgi:photosystem II stability/assembly factor-like uncharacterized protein